MWRIARTVEEIDRPYDMIICALFSERPTPYVSDLTGRSKD